MAAKYESSCEVIEEMDEGSATTPPKPGADQFPGVQRGGATAKIPKPHNQAHFEGPSGMSATSTGIRTLSVPPREAQAGIPRAGQGPGQQGGGGQRAGPAKDVPDSLEESTASLLPAPSRHEITVLKPARLDPDTLEKETQLKTRQGPSTFSIVLKWMCMVVIGSTFLFALISSKLSIVHMANGLRTDNGSLIHDRGANNGTGPGPKTPVYGTESTFFMILIATTLPSAFTLLRSTWCGLLRGDRPWPSKWALAWGVTSSVLESCGVSLLAVFILSNALSLTGISLMNGVFLIPIFFYVVQNARTVRPSKVFFMMTILAAIAEGLGVVFMVLCVFLSDDDINVRTVWQLVLSLVCISAAWAPWVQMQQYYPSKSQFRKLYLAKYKDVPRNQAGEGISNVVFDSSGETSGTSGVGSLTSGAASGSRSGSRYSSIRTQGSESSNSTMTEEDFASIDAEIGIIFRDPKMGARWKCSVVTSLIKLVLIPGFCMLWGYVLGIYEPANLQAGINNVNSNNPMFGAFMWNIFASLGGYLVGWSACAIGIQRSAFAIPLILATPLSFILLLLVHVCGAFQDGIKFECVIHDKSLGFLFSILGALFLYLAQLFSTSYFLFKTQTKRMQKESQLFWLPTYSNVLLEQSLLLNRKNIQTDTTIEDPREIAKRSRVFICTPMYREAPHEMEQLLESYRKINVATQSSGRNFCSHIFMDNGVRDLRLTKFALQLVYVIKDTLGVEMTDCTKVQTPYGMRLSWQLPSVTDDAQENPTEGMHFTLHLKDNQKVKNKKRWSQVMYMSYVLDYFMKEDEEATDMESFILTTDADVKFTPDAAEALLDLMSRDSCVGGVCARTFPMGSGPVYWYQIFDYAIGHWLQKAANHVMGSVLCCPGCFSVFRVAAIRDVLSTFATPVNEASEFLTKDMGEDRWFCTLMIQSGWRMEYCAASADSTYCPTDFDEFWNQRRRWIPSTMANLWLLIRQWDTVSYYNKNMSYWFKIYQALLLVSTLISPAMCILIITGGAYYAWDINQWWISAMALVVVIGYGLVCLYCTQKTQLKIGKVLTVFSSFLMAAVVVGIMTKIGLELQPPPEKINITTIAPPINGTTTTTTRSPPPILFAGDSLLEEPTRAPGMIIELPRGMSLSTLYLAAMVALFLVCGLAHLSEFSCLFHGVWYLLFLPAANIFQLTYSICNITDRSWGTREEKKASEMTNDEPWTEKALRIWKRIFFCCDKSPDGGTPTHSPSNDESSSDEDADQPAPRKNRLRKKAVQSPLVGPSRSFRFKIDRSHSFRFHPEVEDVFAWLPKNFQQEYGPKFKENGYEDTTFVAGMTDSELEHIIGVQNGTHRHAILREIEKLPLLELEPGVPDLVDEWLVQIGLPMYQNNFRYCQIINRKDMEILKRMSKEGMQQDLKIIKPGHLKRLMIAIDSLYYPTKAEQKMAQAKFEIEALGLHQLSAVKSEEHQFWENLRQACLLPDSGAFANDLDLKEKLTELRNSWLMMFAIVNAIWLIVMQTMASKVVLNVQGTNVIGLIFLAIFGFVLLVQFLCMLVHRLGTWAHMIARAPLRRGNPARQTWAFDDRSLAKVPNLENLVTSADVEADTNRSIIKRTHKEKYENKAKRLRGRTRENRESTQESRPLLGEARSPSYSGTPT